MAEAMQRVVDVYGGAVTLVPGGIKVRDQAKLRSAATDQLARQAVFGTGQEREAARWLLWELGQITGARPASINDLYLARGRGECGGFTVPAINVRMLAYDTARAIFRAARAGKAGAIILEIARS
ncbi:MAG TPA: aldolase, partial [Gemmatimonadales bacterium]